MTILRKDLCIIDCERDTRHILVILIAYYEGKRIRRVTEETGMSLSIVRSIMATG